MQDPVAEIEPIVMSLSSIPLLVGDNNSNTSNNNNNTNTDNAEVAEEESLSSGCILGHDSTAATAEPTEQQEPSTLQVDAMNTPTTRETALEKPSAKSPTAQLQQETSVLPWSQVLASPTVAIFSPSSTDTHDTTFYATGLRLAAARAKQTNHANRRCLAVLLDITSLWENYAQAIFKAGQGLQPILSSTTVAAAAATPSLLSVQEATLSWSRECHKLARTVRECLVAQWQGLLVSTHPDAVATIVATLSASRQACVVARQRARHVQEKYRRAVQEAEAAARECQSKESTEMEADVAFTNATASAVTTATVTTESALILEPAAASEVPVRVATKLKQVQRHLAAYQRLVAVENQAVKQCQRLEGMALESMQNLEEDRVVAFCHATRTTLAAQREAVNEMVLALKQDGNEQGASETLVSEKKGRKSLVNLLKATSGQFDAMESSGIMDTETLGLPEEVGKLRDQVRTQIAARSSRIQVVRGLAQFLEHVSSVSAKLGTNLKQLVGKQDESKTNGSMEPLDVALSACEGSQTLTLWNAVAKTIEQEAEAALFLASSLRSLRSQKLDGVLLYSEKSMKVTVESDDAMWRQLCEAARCQSRAEHRYRQNTAQSAKARDRVKSVDSAEKSPSSPKKVNKHLANMFSILPDGGGHAMKMLAPGARASIVQRNLEEADQKEFKGRQILDAAVEATARALDAYKFSAEALSVKYEAEDKSGWLDIKVVLESFVKEAESLRTSRGKALEDTVVVLDTDALVGTVTDINEWAIKTQGIIAKRLTEAEDDSSGNQKSFGAGFMLDLDTIESDAIRGMLASVSREVVEAMDSFDDDEKTDEMGSETVVEDGNASPSTSAIGEGSSPRVSIGDAQSSIEEKQTPMWMKRSLPAPIMTGKSEKANTLRRTLTLGKKILGRADSGASPLDTDTEIFLKYFWPDTKVDPQTVPPVVGSFSCSFRDSSQRLPSQYGRLFVTSARLVFVSWSQKRLVLKWSEVAGIEMGKNFVNAADNTLLITYAKGIDESMAVLGGFGDRSQAFLLVENAREEEKTVSEEMAAAREAPIGTPTERFVGDSAAKVPPDDTIQKMEVVLSKHLRNISIQRYYEIVWSEGNGTDVTPIYGPWLRKASFDVEIGEWKFSDVEGTWCNERFSQKRVVKFKVQRRTHLYIGPPIASVIQTHFCRIECNDKCVVGMTVEFEGIPYSDSFAVSVGRDGRRRFRQPQEGTRKATYQTLNAC